MAHPDPNSSPDPSGFGPAPLSPANPFSTDVCRTPWHVDDSVQGLNADVLDQLVDVVGGQSAGPLMLLTAPRAGYGKTHLLGRVAAAAADQAVIVPVAFRSGDSLTLSTLSRRGIESLAESAVSGDSQGWTRLREVSGHVVLLLLRRLIEGGQLACANTDQALEALSGSGQDVFDPHGKACRIGTWIAQNRESLRGPMAMLAARELPLRAESLDSWMAAMLEQSIHGGLAGMAEMQELTAEDNNSGVPAWLRLLAVWRPVVLLVDHLDGFYRHPDAGVKIASMLMELVEAHRLHVLLSLNQDVWQATFGHHLPSALEDRLTASQVLLRGLTEADAEELLRLRLSQTDISAEHRDEFTRFVSVKRHFLGRPIGSVSARAFLRHCARQWEVFQSAPPSPDEVPATPQVMPELLGTMEVALLPSLETESGGAIPLMTETVRLSIAEGTPMTLPVLFDDQTASDVQSMAESLTEPLAALPQDEVTTSVIDPAPTEMMEGPATSTGHNAQHPATPAGDDNSFEDWSNKPELTEAEKALAPTTDAFVKLREMLARLRQPGQAASVLAAEGQNFTPPAPSASVLSAPESPFRVAAGAQATSPPAAASPFQAASSTVAATGLAQIKIKAPASPADLLQGRFQALRLQLQAEALTQPLDYSRLADLIRLAGRRFPLVRFSEHELSSLTGRYALYWSLQGVEILFGLAPFSDATYWRTLTSFAAGRVTDLASQAEREGGTAPKLKLVSFKTEREQLSWQNLANSQLLPEPIRQITDIVHLDTEGLASLYAMQRIIKESESGVLQAEPAKVIGVLARELDFFWKRITRLT